MSSTSQTGITDAAADEWEKQKKEAIEKDMPNYLLASALVKENSPVYQKMALYTEVAVFNLRVTDLEHEKLEDIYNSYAEQWRGMSTFISDFAYHIKEQIDWLKEQNKIYVSLVYRVDGFANLLDQYWKDVETYNAILENIKDPAIKKGVIETILNIKVFRLGSIKLKEEKLEFQKDENNQFKKEEFEDVPNIVDVLIDWSAILYRNLREIKPFIVSLEEALKKVQPKFILLENYLKEVKRQYTQDYLFLQGFGNYKLTDIDPSYTPTQERLDDLMILPHYETLSYNKALKDRLLKAHLKHFKQK